MSNLGLFDDIPAEPIWFAEGAVLLPGFAAPHAKALLEAITHVTAQAPFRHMHTPGGHRMSVAMSNCGALGWVTDASGYRYSSIDPLGGKHWPPMPGVFEHLARDAAAQAGFTQFVPDACLINRYEPGARMSLHQDRNERDLRWPIVSVSLGLPAVFLFGGRERSEPTQRVGLNHGDVVVWGGGERLHHHGVLPLKQGVHPQTGECRLNLTFRRAG